MTDRTTDPSADRPVRTRFAPSPTGYLHIGGVRTAYFNWILARQAGGQFILRIDDTDARRNVEQALQPILDGFRWLGIDWDEGPEVGGPYGPYSQSQRLERYQAAVQQLVDGGFAYYDFATSEEIAAERQAAERERRDFVYSRTWMAETDDQRRRFESEGRQAVVRLKMPREGQCRFHDQIRGDVVFDWAREQDLVIQRADGTCLYHLANVVDDHDFQITDVVRAVEHLANTPRQIFIIQSLGYELPRYAHIPFVAEPGSQNKLSKRKLESYMKHREFKQLFDRGMRIAERIGIQVDPTEFNPVLVDFYRQIGFLPEAILNYLLLLGWSLDDRTEQFDRAATLEHFSLDRVVKSPARFDPEKLMAFQQRYMGQLTLRERTEKCLPFARAAGWLPDLDDAAAIDHLEPIVRAAGDRIEVAGDILDYEWCFVADDQLEYDPKAVQKRLLGTAGAVEHLVAFAEVLKTAEPFAAEHLHELLKSYCEQQEVKPGVVVNALRVAVTGRPTGFGMFDTLEILGRERTGHRISLALQKHQV